MKTKTPKVYTLPQVGKLLGVGLSSVYDYVNVGLIKTLPRVPGKVGGQRVAEAEYERLKRDGVDSTGIKAMLAERNAPAKTAKKKVAKKRSASAAATKKRVKRKATAAVAKKKPVNSAAARNATKKQKRR